jgi:hypothetical protein
MMYRSFALNQLCSFSLSGLPIKNKGPCRNLIYHNDRLFYVKAGFICTDTRTESW